MGLTFSFSDRTGEPEKMLSYSYRGHNWRFVAKAVLMLREALLDQFVDPKLLSALRSGADNYEEVMADLDEESKAILVSRCAGVFESKEETAREIEKLDMIRYHVLAPVGSRSFDAHAGDWARTRYGYEVFRTGLVINPGGYIPESKIESILSLGKDGVLRGEDVPAYKRASELKLKSGDAVSFACSLERLSKTYGEMPRVGSSLPSVAGLEVADTVWDGEKRFKIVSDCNFGITLRSDEAHYSFIQEFANSLVNSMYQKFSSK
ncbi:hypothetical protein JW711_05440 [Candidatus Woesearchaeota archaeon]|nr:hypothetical protein [Candidatus Woesearchaeota archaeon]